MFSEKTALEESNPNCQKVIEAVKEFVLESVTKEDDRSEFKVGEAYLLYGYSLVNCCDVESRWTGVREVPASIGFRTKDRSTSLDDLFSSIKQNQADVSKSLEAAEFFSIAIPAADPWACRHLEYYLRGTDHVFTCPKCQGSGRITCHACAGRGEVSCTNCNGTAWIGSGENRRPCTNCNPNGKVSCKTCSGSGTLQCPRCEGEGQLLEFKFFAISNSGDLSVVNLFPSISNGEVERLAQERLFHLGKDKSAETRNLLRGRMKPFEEDDDTGSKLPPPPSGTHEDYVVEGNTILVHESDNGLEGKNLFEGTEVPLGKEEKQLLMQLTLDSAGWLRENLPLGKKARMIRREKVVLNRRPYYILDTEEEDQYFVTLNPPQVTTESAMSWEKCKDLLKKFGICGAHRLYSKRYYLAALHMTSCAWLVFLLGAFIFNFDDRGSETIFFWFLFLGAIQGFWLYKENGLLDRSKLIDIDGNPIVNPGASVKQDAIGIETVPEMELASLEKEQFKRI